MIKAPRIPPTTAIRLRHPAYTNPGQWGTAGGPNPNAVGEI